jgi:DNA-binding beta-propeller fold protein YncE
MRNQQFFRQAIPIVSGLLAFAASSTGSAQVVEGQAVDANGAPLYQVDPFWPKSLPNNWSMQQVTGIGVDDQDIVWFLNRPNAPDPLEIIAESEPRAVLCCVLGPEVIAVDPEGDVVHAWGGPEYEGWPGGLQTVIPDSQGFVWDGGTRPRESIQKFTRDGELVWDFGHRVPEGVEWEENNQEVDNFAQKGRFQIDEEANEIYIIDQKRVVVFDASSGEFKRGWGGHGMPLDEITNDPIPGYEWDGGPPPEEENFVPAMHFVEISNDGLVYIGERGQNRIQVFTKQGEWQQDIYVSPNTPSQRACGSLDWMPCPAGTMYKMVISVDEEQKYLFVADAANNVIWSVDRRSGETLGHFSRPGRLAGELNFPNAISIDSKGNIYTGEVSNGKRIQKFVPVMAGGR